jgi:hypothetical protein
MEPADYGAGAWKFIHASAGNALEAHKRTAFAEWMERMPAMFPCDLCGGHLKETLKAYPLNRYLGSAEDLLRWTYIAHDAANNNYNRHNPSRPRKRSPSWEQVKADYLALPSPEAEPVPVVAPVVAPNRHRYTMNVAHPAFEQFRSSFRHRR